MSSQQEKAQQFQMLHKKGDPIIIYNAWDAGSARAIHAAGAKAIGTGSWSLAEAQGYNDGQKLPIDELYVTAAQIANAVDVPVSIDFEGGYATEPDDIAENVSVLIDAGIIGINFEDQVIGGDGLHDIDTQSKRIKAIREMANDKGIDLFINARTDYFLKEGDPTRHKEYMNDALKRAEAYTNAGASGFFVPGLMNEGLITEICDNSPLPVNILMKEGMGLVGDLANCGVSRISHGPFPYMRMMEMLKEQAALALSDF